MGKSATAALIMLLGIALAIPALAGGHDQQRETRKGILLVAFGTSVPSAQRSFRNIEEKVKAAYPDIPVRWAYTSQIIRHKLAKQGQHFDSPEMALSKMMDEGFTHVAVQSLHTIAGEEFDDLRHNVHAFDGMAGGFEKIEIGYPLLGTEQDLERVTAAMISNVPAERKKSEAVVFMGHGTPHPSNAFYAAMMYHFQQQDPNIFVGTVEGSPDINDVKKALVAKKIKKAYLIPFMSVAGDHAMNDMAGDEPDSWKSILTAAGIQCVPVLKGTAEYDNIVAIWVEHLGAALSRL
jgi:sirohydrochlorin cobaltochelatase